MHRAKSGCVSMGTAAAEEAACTRSTHTHRSGTAAEPPHRKSATATRGHTAHPLRSAWNVEAGFSAEQGAGGEGSCLVHVFGSDKQCFNSSPDLLVIEIPVEEACHIEEIQVPWLLPLRFAVPESITGPHKFHVRKEGKSQGLTGGHGACRVLWHTRRRAQGWGCSRAPSAACRGLYLAKHCFLAKLSIISWRETPDQADTYRTSREAYRAGKSWSEEKQESFLLTMKPDKAAAISQQQPAWQEHPQSSMETFCTVLDLRCLFMLKRNKGLQ